VTETYVADVVTASGPLTTYTTATIHESTGSYARVLESLATGSGSTFDGAAFNGRRTLSDGRSVAGTYYENYVLTAAGFVPVSIVFFQDDSELERLATTTRTASPLASDPPERPSTSRNPERAACCATAAVNAPRPAHSRRQDQTPTIRPGVSLLPATAPLTRIEVLRGREVSFWLRAFVGDDAVSVRSWRLISGDAGDPSSTFGAGTVPFQTVWTRLAPAGMAYELTFRLEVDTPATGRQSVHAAIAVTVRSPALED
jgi:hypothetical protein